MRVLYVATVGPFGGASRSLYEALRALPPGMIEPYVVMQEGTATEFYSRVAKDVLTTRGLTRFDNTRYSGYRGVRWLVTLRELFHLPFTLAIMIKARRRWKSVDLIHVNDIVDIIPGLIAKFLFRAPMIVHTRCLCRTDERSPRTRWLNSRLRDSAAAVIAIDENVRATLPADVRVEVIHNSFDPAPAGMPSLEYLSRLEKLRPSALKVGYIGNLHKSKGLRELLGAAVILKAAGEDVQFVVIGGSTAGEANMVATLLRLAGIAQNVRKELWEAVERYSLMDDFLLMGPTPHIHAIFEKIDVLAFPSHLDAPGRSVFEAAFFSIPSIVAVREPRGDTVVHGQTAIVIPEPNPGHIAQAIAYFARNRDEVKRMGWNARELAMRNFDPVRNSRQLVALYRQILENSSRAAP